MRGLFQLLQRHNGDNFGNELQVLQKLVDVIMKEKVKIPSAQEVEEIAPVDIVDDLEKDISDDQDEGNIYVVKVKHRSNKR